MIHFRADKNDTLVEDSSQFDVHPDKQNVNSSPQILRVVRKLEQSMISIIGEDDRLSTINVKVHEKGIIVSVNRADSLITINDHLYLSSQTQNFKVSPLKSLKEIRV